MNNHSRKMNEIFENLFVLELANNHWGNLDRGLKIIRDHAVVIRYNNVRAAIKLQFRDVDEFIHKDFKNNDEIRYIKKTRDTRLTKSEFARMVDEIRKFSVIPMATPFDERSVDLCSEFDMPIIKIASSDINDWPLIEKVASKKLPVIISSGGASEKNLDDLVSYFEKRSIPLAINHCVALYPSEDAELEIDQVDYLKSRYPNHVIGLSTHEHRSWDASMFLSYAKGARTWERHIDIDYQGVAVSPYCSLPEQIDRWFKAYNTAREMCGGTSTSRRVCSRKEVDYLNGLVRGVYAKRDLSAGHILSSSTFDRDFYLAVPLQKGQLSCREVMNGEHLVRDLSADTPLSISDIDGPYAEVPSLRQLIETRGV